MKFTITRESLQEGLVSVAASVPTKTTLPVLSNIMVEASADGVRLSGTDLDIAVSTVVPAEVDEEGTVTLPAKKLVEIVRELPSAAVRLTAAGDQRVQLECGRSKFNPTARSPTANPSTASRPPTRPTIQRPTA